MLDLYNNKYDRATLKANIYDLQLIDILKTQELDVFFIVRYILNEKYQFTEEDMSINVGMVLAHQPHISREQLLGAIYNYDSDDDSVVFD